LKLEPAREAAIVKEISQHLNDCYQEALSSGATPAEAERRAIEELGASEALQHELRRVERPSPQEPIVFGTNKRINMIADLWQDLRYGARMLMKSRGFTVAAVFTLALGISANITIFSIVSEYFFKPLPVKDPERLVWVLQKNAVWDKPHGHSWLDFRDYRERLEVFSDMLAVAMGPAHLSVAGHQPDREWIEMVSGNYFSMLGVEPRLGRLFRRDEGEKPGADPIIVLSHEYWQRKFGGDASVIGKTLNVNGHPFTIVGVTPETFGSAQWKLAPRAFVPASMLGQARPDGDELMKARAAAIFKVMARLKPGVTVAQAGAAAEIAGKHLAREYPDEHKGASVFVALEQYCRPEPVAAEFMPLVASVFMAMVGLVLLIACDRREPRAAHSPIARGKRPARVSSRRRRLSARKLERVLAKPDAYGRGRCADSRRKRLVGLARFRIHVRNLCPCRRRDGVGARAARDAVRYSDHAQGWRRRAARVEPPFLPQRAGGLASGDLRRGADRRGAVRAQSAASRGYEARLPH
jgi:hypothetical protein